MPMLARRVVAYPYLHGLVDEVAAKGYDEVKRFGLVPVDAVRIDVMERVEVAEIFCHYDATVALEDIRA